MEICVIFARNLKSTEVLPWFPLLGLWGYFQLIGAGNQHFPKLGSSFIFLLPLPGSHHCHCSEYKYPQNICSHFNNYQNHLHEPQIQLQVLISDFDPHHHERRLFLMSGWSILTIYLLAHPASTQPNYLRPNASGSRRPRSHWSTAPTGSTNERAALHLAGGAGALMTGNVLLSGRDGPTLTASPTRNTGPDRTLGKDRWKRVEDTGGHRWKKRFLGNPEKVRWQNKTLQKMKWLNRFAPTATNCQLPIQDLDKVA